MSAYINTGFDKFKESLNARIYVDKSELIDILNNNIKTPQKYICISRPRRFGKSVTANMLCAYYSKNTDSSFIFDNLNVSKSDSYRKHLNQYNIIFLNMTDEFNRAEQNVTSMIKRITAFVVAEIKEAYPEIKLSDELDLSLSLQSVYSQTRIGFVIVIDEWDCIMREKQSDSEGLKTYLEWLKLLMKDKDYVALAYMTGILPIKKYGSHSALNMFKEYSMTDAGKYAPYIGFTEDEVLTLCEKYKLDSNSMKKWYDGYSFENSPHLYNPNSVVCAIDENKFKSYWTQTETFESLRRYIDLNMAGLRDEIVKLIAGNEIVVNTSRFHNDMTTFESKDDVLTLLIHLGYLAINPSSNIRLASSKQVVARIPNEEIKDEFRNITEENRNYPGIYSLISQSLDLLDKIYEMDSKAVAEAFDLAHQDHTSILKYNDENSLSCIISLALNLASVDLYNVYRELPAGKGFADMVFLPKQGVDKPALLVELKYDKSAQTAIDQIKQKNYGRIFRDYEGDVLVVGINYDKDTKEHKCKIEKYHE
ncbi:AAA family ATPase [Succinivibrio dextrinosolvens]|uniref:AAA family ATPase n=1 Tax=Succinivibrio dextrinosolvens TaxID=83771 RepID=UPI00241F2D94|nr:AAA family ATPase [Succinivibrio dextrinosolvens]MBE6423604.1 AAA family ATPase [Succinivibrio dextrinosolvens]